MAEDQNEHATTQRSDDNGILARIKSVFKRD